MTLAKLKGNLTRSPWWDLPRRWRALRGLVDLTVQGSVEALWSLVQTSRTHPDPLIRLAAGKEIQS